MPTGRIVHVRTRRIDDSRPEMLQVFDVGAETDGVAIALVRSAMGVVDGVTVAVAGTLSESDVAALKLQKDEIRISDLPPRS
jgi:hypothetical protein